MFTAFSIALSALSANATAVDVVGNNLANLNTTGYKPSVLSFRDLVSQSLGAGLGETQVGFGTAQPLTSRQFTQGAIQASSGVLDAAIQGDGFFMVRDQQNGLMYTRAGNFHVDAAGNLLTSAKEKVQGWTEVNGVLNTNGPVGDIVVLVGALRQPFATTQFSMDANLNAGAVVGSSDATFSNPIEVVDSLGVSHVLTVSFTKTGANAWSYAVTIPGSDVTGGTAGTPTSLTTGAVSFNAQGQMTTPSAANGNVAIAVNSLADGAANMSISWALYNPDQTSKLTQFSQPSAVSGNQQNGLAAAQLVRVGIGDGGKIQAQYSNGQQRIVGQLALASIRNPQSLIAVGNNNLQASADTALPAVGLQQTGGRGKIVGAALESSAVDMAREFTNLIVVQRGYQANARVITAVDELSQETINLRR